PRLPLPRGIRDPFAATGYFAKGFVRIRGERLVSCFDGSTAPALLRNLRNPERKILHWKWETALWPAGSLAGGFMHGQHSVRVPLHGDLGEARAGWDREHSHRRPNPTAG